MSGDCLLLRKEVKQLSIKLHKDSNNCVLRQTFASHRKKYNKLRKNVRNNYFSLLVNKVNSPNPKHSKSLWNVLKDTTSSKINPAIPLSSDEWVNYSKSLLQSKGDNYDKLTDEELLDTQIPIDLPFTCTEVVFCC